MKAVGPWARRVAFILPLAGMLVFAISFCAVSYSTAQRLVDDGMGGLKDGMGRIAYRPLRIGDEGLVGNWEVVSVEERGSAEPFVEKGDDLGFTFEGTYYGICFHPPGDYSFGPLDTTSGVVASDGVLVSEQMNASIASSDAVWEYSLGDLSEEEIALLDDPSWEFYKWDPLDRLQLHIRATSRPSATNAQDIDCVITFAKCFPNWGLPESLLMDSLCGNWTGDAGSTWDFFCDANGRGYYRFQSASGKVITGRIGMVFYRKATGREYLSLSLNGQGGCADLAIETFEYDRLVLIQDDASRIVLTRNGKDDVADNWGSRWWQRAEAVDRL